MMICPLGLLLLQVPAPAPAAQDPKIPVHTSADQSQEATDLLRAVARAQFSSWSKEYVDTLDLGVTLRERGEHPREVSFTVFYSNYRGERLELVIDDPERGTKVAKGFSGNDYWLREDQGERLILSGHEFTKDRKSIDEAMDLCSDLLLLVDVRSLERREAPKALEILADGTRVVIGVLRRPDGLLWDYRLGIPADGLQPQWLEVSHLMEPDQDSEPQVLYQRFHMLGYKEFDRRQVPQLIQVFDRPEAELPARILELHRFRWESHPPAKE